MARDFIQMSLLDLMQPEEFAAAETIAPQPTAALPFPCSSCRSSHPGCDKCCNTCKDICNAQQYCLVEETAEEAKQTEQAENDRRASICATWETCEYKNICFTPQNEDDGICFVDEPHRIPADLRPVFSRDEQKVLAAGFSLVRYTRDEKKIEISNDGINDGWATLEPFPTYAAAERKLNEYKTAGYINTGLEGKIIMTGWNQPGGLLKAGFEFFRCYGLKSYDQLGGYCIKQGSRNWSNLAKFGTREELKTAWDKLMNEDMKALEG